MLILYILGLIIVFVPVYLLVWIGPNPTRDRWLYFFIGLFFAAIAGLALYWINLDVRLNPENPQVLWARLSRASLAGFLEELIRYPALLIANHYGRRLISKSGEVLLKVNSSQTVWTRIPDPHGLGMYFGVGWGLAETFGFYIYPKYLAYMDGVEWQISDHILPLIYRITAVMAHTALTYLAMIITINKGFYRLTMIVHIGSNVVNEIFAVLTTTESSSILVIIFTRFSIVVIAYFFLRPKVRYLSPALLLLIEIILFLLFILIGSFVYLFYKIFSAGIIDGAG